MTPGSELRLTIGYAALDRQLGSPRGCNDTGSGATAKLLFTTSQILLAMARSRPRGRLERRSYDCISRGAGIDLARLIRVGFAATGQHSVTAGSLPQQLGARAASPH